MRVLVVSESARERLRATAALRSRPGVEVVEAPSAGAAHETARDGDFDVLVIDGDMRPEGGFSLLYELRAHAQYEGLPAAPAIILVARDDDRWLARWAGAQDVVVKPFDPFDLADRVLELRRVTGGEVASATPGQTAGRELAMDAPPELDAADAPPLGQPELHPQRPARRSGAEGP